MHFDASGVAAGSAFPAGVESNARALHAALDALGDGTSRQAAALGAALAQVEAYAAELASLQEAYTRAEQALRHAAQAHSPRDADAAQTHRQVSFYTSIKSEDYPLRHPTVSYQIASPITRLTVSLFSVFPSSPR